MRYLVSIVMLCTLAACGEVTSDTVDASSQIDAPGTCDPACGANATCQGTACVCDAGYQMAAGVCADIDECATANGGCAADAVCFNTPGARTCACRAGFLGDGLTCAPVWTLQATLPFDINPSNFGSAFVAHNNLVYIGIETNTPTAKAFRSFNTSNLLLSGPLALPPTTDDDFCACGATQTMASNGTSVFMFGNYAQLYNPTANTWSPIAGYTSPVDYRRAESASVYNPMNGSVQMFGDRGPTAEALNYRVSPSGFSFDANLPIAISDAVAFLPLNGATIYLAGGEQQGGADRILSRPTNLASWTIHAAAPGSIRSPIGMGDFGTRIWVAAAGKIHFFNPTTLAWDITRDLPARTQGVVTTNVGTFAFVHTTTAMLEVYRLATIE